MAQQENLIERMDTIKANSVTEREFEETWGFSLETQVENMLVIWNHMMAQAKETIDNDNQPTETRQQSAAEDIAVNAGDKEEL